jgi:hypothetical protein
MGAQFLKILDKSFPTSNPLRRIFNKNTVKISYCCLPNVKDNIDSHNTAMLRNQANEVSNRKCNCRQKDNCPLNGHCLEKGVVYLATVKTDHSTETYVGLTETDFKSRFNNHKSSFNHASRSNSTELSKYTRTLKNTGTQHSIEWSIPQRARPYSNSTKRCNLCISEKYYIMYKPHLASLNKRTEMLNTCRHSRKYLLSTSHNNT